MRLGSGSPIGSEAGGQCIYLETVRPRELADVVVDNTDPEWPRLSRGAGGARP